MANARKILKKIGGQKRNSARRSSSRRRSRVMSRWKYIAIAALTTVCTLALLYRPVILPAFQRFVTCNGHKIYGACIPKGYSIYGIDVSHHQDRISWSRLKQGTQGEPPISFAYMKATEGSSHCDTRFEENWKSAKENGFIRGAYHYFSTESSGAKQAQLFIGKVKLEPGDLPPMVDIEDEPENSAGFKRELKIFIDTLEKHYKVKPIIYTYKKFHDKHISGDTFGNYPLWIAQYNTKRPGIDREWILWQCTENGRLPGIRQKVDINIFNGTIEELQSLAIK